HLLKKAFLGGILKNSSAQYVSVFTMLMSSPLGKFVTNTHLEKFGEKADLDQCYIEDVEKLLATIGNGEEAKERKKAFLKGVESNSHLDSEWNEYMNKLMVEVE
ncbi:MAG: hypothetical protein LBB21_02775, partial [Holosporaceae bacterium]|nr:hypothetical protein [Holosporaceae bacterium]